PPRASSRLCSGRRPPAPPLFPYATLFRSPARPGRLRAGRRGTPDRPPEPRTPPHLRRPLRLRPVPGTGDDRLGQGPLPRDVRGRSEEHTSELQSRENLVCRLLLEKKNSSR